MLVVEDQPEDLDFILQDLAKKAPGVLEFVTAVCLVRAPRGDTRDYIREWLGLPGLQVVATLASLNPTDEELSSAEPLLRLSKAFPERLKLLPANILDSLDQLGKALADMLRPGGFYLQDVQLESLGFVPPSELWKSVSTLTVQVKTFFSHRKPEFWLMSNKTGFQHTFMRDVEEMGFSQDRVIRKDELEEDLSSYLRNFFDESMPFKLKQRRGEEIWQTVVGEEDRDEIFRELDLVLWQIGQRVTLGGRLVEKGRIKYRVGSAESKAWSALFRDFFELQEGLPTRQFGEWQAPDHVKKDLSGYVPTEYAPKLASRLRSKVAKWDPIITSDGTYRLSAERRIAWASLASSPLDWSA